MLTTQLQLVSITANGTPANYHSGYNALAISRDGNLIGFYTDATNLFTTDPYGADYALKNMTTGQVTVLTQVTASTSNDGVNGGAVAGYDTLVLNAAGTATAFGSSSSFGVGTDGTDEDIYKLDLAAGQIVRISEAQGGSKAYHAYNPDISDNGRYVVFSASDNLLASSDTNGSSDSDVYWYDSHTGELRMVSGEFDGSVQGGGDGTEGDSWDAHVSNDGRFVVFQSIALNLRPESTGGGSKQLFLRDMDTDQIYLISTDATSAPGNGSHENPEITPDARYVVFGSNSSNLINGVQGWNVFRLDLNTGTIDVVNRTADGTIHDGAFNPEITPDGRYVVFESTETGLVPGSAGYGTQIYVKDMATGAIAAVSMSEAGAGGSASAYAPQISDDGQYIVFNTRSALIAGDTNGYEDVYRALNPVYAWGGDLNNDTFVNSPEAETFNGGAGLDLIVFSGDKADYSISSSSVSAAGVTDILSGVERLQFWDKKVALDVTSSGHAGQAMGLIGVLAPSLMSDPAIRGLIISLFDGGSSMQQLSELVLSAGLLPTDPTQLANTVFQNVTGQPATTEWTSLLTDYIDTNGAANFVATIAGMAINAQLDVYSQTGLEYL